MTHADDDIVGRSTDASNRFDGLTFDSFRRLAKDDSLSRHEKVGFPNDYREGKETAIFRDISTKLELSTNGCQRVLEIGPGCSGLPMMLAALCRERGHELFFVDSAEMLFDLPDSEGVTKIEGQFPLGPEFHEAYSGTIDKIVVYSVIQYVFADGNIFDFLDKCLLLLRPGGRLLIGDLPNSTMRKRFFSSEKGVESHREYTKSDNRPNVVFNNLEPGSLDDAVVASIVARARAEGFHAWVVPQARDLPMANRREDILIERP